MDDSGTADHRQGMRLLRFYALRIAALILVAALLVTGSLVVGRRAPVTPQIAFQSNRMHNWDVYLIDVLRGLEVQVTFERSFDYSPTWSPDGTRVAFVSSRSGFYDIYVVDFTRHATYAITTDFSAETDPVWLDAQTLRYKVMGEIETGDYLYQLDLTSGERYFLGSEDRYTRPSVISPDATRAAAIKLERGNLDIAVWHVGATDEGRIAAHTTNENYPAWSSDSDWLAFASDRDGNWEIYIASLDGEVTQRVTYDRHQDILPSWRPGR